MSNLTLFPDTNLFIQCRDLSELEWKDIGEFDEITLIVSRPVHKEIDSQKGRGNDRLGRRARSTAALFKKIITNGGKAHLVRETAPKVVVALGIQSQPSANLDGIDLRENDDRILAIAHGYSKEHEGEDVRVITHDSGPLALAAMIGLPAIDIPDGWLREPEPSSAERENAKLKREIEHLKRHEPSFVIEAVDDSGSMIKRHAFEQERFESLSDSEVDDFLSRLKKKHPLRQNFDEADPPPVGWQNARGIITGLGGTLEFNPPSEDEMLDYIQKRYPKWVSECETFFRSLGQRLNCRRPNLLASILIRNDGVRPAKDALVTFETRGNIKIRPPMREGEKNTDDDRMELPRSPAVPRGKWVTPMTRATSSLFGAVAAARAMNTFEILNEEVSPLAIHRSLHHLGKRDPNSFYYKSERPEMPVDCYALECEQWRHAASSEEFIIEFHPDGSGEVSEGSLICKVEAENLSDPVVIVTPVRILETTGSTISVAEKLIELSH